jgi:hypothetical protein
MISIRRILENYPPRASILLTLVTLSYAAVNIFRPNAFAPANYIILSLFVVGFGIFMARERMRNKAYSSVLVNFQTWFTDFEKLIAPKQEGRPDFSLLRLMKQITAIAGTAERKHKEQPTRKRDEAWTAWEQSSLLIEAMHNTLVEDLQYFADACDDMLASGVDGESDVVKKIADQSWRILLHYHRHVVEPILRMREEIRPGDKSLRQEFSKFREFYNDTLKEMETARRKASSEYELGLDSDVREFVLPVIE